MGYLEEQLGLDGFNSETGQYDLLQIIELENYTRENEGGKIYCVSFTKEQNRCKHRITPVSHQDALALFIVPATCERNELKKMLYIPGKLLRCDSHKSDTGVVEEWMQKIDQHHSKQKRGLNTATAENQTASTNTLEQGTTTFKEITFVTTREIATETSTSGGKTDITTSHVNTSLAARSSKTITVNGPATPRHTRSMAKGVGTEDPEIVSLTRPSYLD
jgi:hypothetical protein